MTLTNRDASQITLKQRQKALYSWKSHNISLVNIGRSVLREQPTSQSAAVVVDRQQGACKCANDSSDNPYQFNGLTQCGCGAGNF